MTTWCDHVSSRGHDYVWSWLWSPTPYQHSLYCLLVMTMVTSHWWSWRRHDLSSRTQNSWLSHVFLLPIKKISEQPCFNGEPMRHTVLWEEIRTTHKLPESPMGHVPMGTTEPWRCVSMNQCVGSPPPSSRHHFDRTRTLVSWSPRHRVTPLSSRKPNANRKSTKRAPMDVIRE